MAKQKRYVGWVYVLSNAAMPGIVKIGHSEYSDVQQRVTELSRQTAVPVPFNLEYSVLVEAPHKIELTVHRKLHQHRVSPKREFFYLDAEDAIEAINHTVFGTNQLLEVPLREFENLSYLYGKYPEMFSGDRAKIDDTMEKINSILSPD